MRVQCDVCESAVAVVLCCADEAALCLPCDQRVHAANKLAGKHQRLHLLNDHHAKQLPQCDICQEKTAFIFCLEDRALLCRDCDVSLHLPNTLASSHQRFLATGVRIALNAAVCQQDSVSVLHGKPEEPGARFPGTEWAVQVSKSKGLISPMIPLDVPGETEFMHAGKRPSMSTTAPGVVPAKRGSAGEPWHVEKVMNLPDLESGYLLGDIVSSKADLSTLGDYDWMADFGILDEHTSAESLAEVPQIAPIINGWSQLGKLNMGVKAKVKEDLARVPDFDDEYVVPDLGLHSNQFPSLSPKRRKVVIDV